MVSLSRRGKPNNGFTLLETLVVISIIAFGAAIALPYMENMVSDYRLRSASRVLVAHLNQMKLRAIRNNVRIAISIDATNDTYTIFVDDNPENWALDDDEDVILGRDNGENASHRVTDLSEQGLEITSNLVSSMTGFNGRGMQDRAVGGTITITAANNKTKRIIISSIGTIRVN